jgi:hypothetical protein
MKKGQKASSPSATETLKDPGKMCPFSALREKQNFERISYNEEVAEIFYEDTFFFFGVYESSS